jgi:hypothetical protein
MALNLTLSGIRALCLTLSGRTNRLLQALYLTVLLPEITGHIALFLTLSGIHGSLFNPFWHHGSLFNPFLAEPTG